MVAGLANKAQDNFIQDMFVMDSLRGIDSCGLATVEVYQNRTNMFKKSVLPHDFLDMGGYKSLINKRNHVMIGHNRWATKGTVNSTNAHPFNVGNITGVHNGTLLNQWRLPDHEDFEVDSENIFHSIDKIGIVETWKLIEGAAALIWWDAKDGTVNFIRNDKRPLVFAYSKDLNQMYAASEMYMLLGAMWRNGIASHDVEVLPPDTLYSFKVNIAHPMPKEKVKCTTRKLSPFQPVVHKKAAVNYLHPIDSKRKKIGERVDFIVDSCIYAHNTSFLTVIDNATKLEYVIEMYTARPMLREDDLATGVVQRIKNGEYFISPHSVVFNSGYQIVDDNKNKKNKKDSKKKVTA